MKVTATAIGFLSAGAFTAQSVAAASVGDVDKFLEYGIVAAVLGWVLIRHLPQREKAHAEATQRREAAHQNERTDLIARLDNQRDQHNEQMRHQAEQHTMAVKEMTEQHAIATQSGHAVATQLSGDIKSVEGQLREITRGFSNGRGQSENKE